MHLPRLFATRNTPPRPVFDTLTQIRADYVFRDEVHGFIRREDTRLSKLYSNSEFCPMSRRKSIVHT